MKKCAFLTLDERGDFVIDDENAVAPLAELGWSVSTVSWRQRERPWGDFDAVLIRSTWDYWHDVPAFLDTLAEIDRETRLANPLELVHWNLRKTYLRELESRGAAIVPTAWLEEFRAGDLAGCAERLDSDQFVIKPVVGANGDDAYRLSSASGADELERLEYIFDGRACMLQTFRPAVQEEGEYSLFYFGGRFSHAILKRPAAGEFRSQEERGARITPIKANPVLARSGQAAIDALPRETLYARVDLVRNDAGRFELMELELIEPSLYLRSEPGAPRRFAQAIDDWFAQ